MQKAARVGGFSLDSSLFPAQEEQEQQVEHRRQEQDARKIVARVVHLVEAAEQAQGDAEGKGSGQQGDPAQPGRVILLPAQDTGDQPRRGEEQAEQQPVVVDQPRERLDPAVRRSLRAVQQPVIAASRDS